jgi:non-specific serine/threonine protein kinase
VPTPNNLPAQLSSFVGRERQLAELRRLLRKSRLITLTGPGGAGKTRLALQLAETVLDRYPDGVWLVGLAALDDARLLHQTVASVCAVREERRRPINEVLTERLASQRTLLVLDGCEYLVEPCAAMVDRLLRSCPKLAILVTSREPLGVTGEVIWRIPSLTVPGPEGVDRIDLLLKSEAVLLFVDRARLAQPAFHLDRNISGELAEVCTRLEGLPLAIELAASLVDAMTVHEIRGRLHDRFRLLTGGGSRAVPRHQTLRLAVDWSYALLSPDEKVLFAQLALFAGGFDAEAAEAVGRLDPEQSADVLSVLLRLVDKSLVIAEGRGSSRMRYRLLDTIREYAAEKLGPEESFAARQRHAMYFLEFCEQSAAKLRLPEQTYWLGRIAEDEANIRGALTWFQAEAPEKLALLARYMSRFWYIRSKFMEGLEWLDASVQAHTSVEARFAVLLNRAILRRHHGDYPGAIQDTEECANLARQEGWARHLMVALNNLGAMTGATGQFSEARRYTAEGRQLGEQLGDDNSIAGCLNNLALVESATGNHQAAKDLIDRALVAADKMGDPAARGVFLETAGRIERRSGTLEAARQRFLDALGISTQYEDVLTTADILDGFALLAASQGDPSRTLVLLAASVHQRAMRNSERSPVDEAEIQGGLQQAKTALSKRTADAAWQRGSAMGLNEAIAYATGAIAEPAPKGAPALTPREMQVASLIADGLTNFEISSRLKMAGRTADAHVEHIRNKLGLRTRAQIAVWAHDHLVEA